MVEDGSAESGAAMAKRRNRRARSESKRRRVLYILLSDDEHAALVRAAEREHLATAAWAALTLLAAASGTPRAEHNQVREVLQAVLQARGQAQRIGVNLNQAVAALNSGEVSSTIQWYAHAAAQTVRKLDNWPTNCEGGCHDGEDIGTERCAVIGKVLRGVRVQGLLRYLYGPGANGEHHDPRIVAGFGDAADMEPVVGPDGRRDFRHLEGLLTQPLALLGDRNYRKPVWHCAVRAAPEDPVLADEQWAQIAAEIMKRTGLAPAGDVDAVRWIAVRHAGDHVHIVATLARPDGIRPEVWNDGYRVRDACRAVEARSLCGQRRRRTGRPPAAPNAARQRRPSAVVSQCRPEPSCAARSRRRPPARAARASSSNASRPRVSWCGSGSASGRPVN